MSELTLYVSSTSANKEVKKQQQRMEMVLSGKKIAFIKVDVSMDSDGRDKMREIVGDETALPPQIANGDSYCGDYDAFDAAIESEALEEFLKLK